MCLYHVVDFVFGFVFFFFFQAEDGIRDWSVTGVQTCALPILLVIFQVPAKIVAHKLTKSCSISKFKNVLCISQALPQFGLIHLNAGCKFNVGYIFLHTMFVFH